MLTAQRYAITAPSPTLQPPSLRKALLRWADGAIASLEARVAALHLEPALRRQRVLRLTANLAVVAMVLVLPFAAAGSTTTTADPMITSSSAGGYEAYGTDAARQATTRGLVTGGRNPVTTTSEGTRPVRQYTVKKGDTLGAIALQYDVSAESLAFANGISDPTSISIGRELLVPPADGALYTVQAGDTVASVAARFKVDPTVIMTWNRLYFEPEHFAPGQLVFVANGEVPALVYQTVDRTPTFIARPAGPSQVTRSGRLSWPVGGLITQYYWYAHKGVDIAAPYGTGIAVPEDGVVISTGWVAVGGLSLRVRHDSGLITGYYHMSSIAVSVGQRVSRSQIVGAIGLTGVTTGPHVHWECQIGSALVDCLSQ